MKVWFFILGGVYLFALVSATIGARKQTHSSEDFMTAGSDLGVFLGCLTVAATLFSTFTLLGMPDFFRTHGIGAWIFLAVSDAVLAFVIIWFGFHLRKKAAEKGFRGVAGLMTSCYGSRWAGYLYLAGIFLFMIPYVAIQIRGIGIFLNATFPEMLPVWGWSALIVAVLLTYSELGGLKAIIYADAIQGVILLIVSMIIAYGCVSNFGGVEQMFNEVRVANAELLSVPGPQGLFTTQFLIASFLVIILVPVTQPQITIRLVIMKDLKSMHRMALMLGLFALVVILCTIPMGMYGAVHYADANTSDFLGKTLIADQLPIIAAAVVVGLIAASISTADSQLFALGTELRSMLKGDEQKLMLITKLAIICFALGALIVAIFSNNQLVLLARVSFAGTAMLAPFILVALLMSRAPGKEVIVATAIALAVFLASVAGLIEDKIGSTRLDLLLILSLSTFVALSVVCRQFVGNKTLLKSA